MTWEWKLVIVGLWGCCAWNAWTILRLRRALLKLTMLNIKESLLNMPPESRTRAVKELLEYARSEP